MLISFIELKKTFLVALKLNFYNLHVKRQRVYRKFLMTDYYFETC